METIRLTFLTSDFADFDGGKGKQEDDSEGDAEKASPILRNPNALLAEVGLLDEWDESE